MANTPKRQKRYQLSLPLWIRIQERFKGKKKPASQPIIDEETITENISSTGCYFLVSGKPPVGSIAEMEITLPHTYRGGGTGTLHCRARVVRVDEKKPEGKAGVACRFESYKLSF
jgi:hypothetical protein